MLIHPCSEKMQYFCKSFIFYTLDKFNLFTKAIHLIHVYNFDYNGKVTPRNILYLMQILVFRLLEINKETSARKKPIKLVHV